jgi:CheY-like chemotaxis protein
VKIRVLVLDDNENRHDVFRHILPDASLTHVYTADEAITALQEKPRFNLLCLDHDLGDFKNKSRSDDPGDGTMVAEFIAQWLDKKQYPDSIIVHSANFHASRRMAAILRAAGLTVTIKPFSNA